MKQFIYVMSMNKVNAKRQMSSFAFTIMEHIIKLIVYSDIRPNDVNGWVHTVARCIYNADDIKIKPNSKKLSEQEL